MSNNIAIIQTLFGQVEQESIWKFTFHNAQGTSVSVLNYGGIITDINTLDKNGQSSNIVLGFDNFQSYHLLNSAYFGAVVGRNCNRIAAGKFSLTQDVQTVYNLAVNNGPNHLHGGIKGFDKKVFKFQIVQPNVLILESESVDGEEGYPGNLQLKIIYELTSDNEFKMRFECQSDKQTICNLTSHSYFNLQTEKKYNDCMKDHSLQLNSHLFTPLDATSIPTGEILSVKNTPFDFTQAKQIDESLSAQAQNEQLKIGKGFDHNYIINKKTDLNLAAKVKEHNSGRTLEIYTNQIGVQFYTGNYLSGVDGFSDNAGFCLETQAIPNSINIPHFPSVELSPHQQYLHLTIYKFGIDNN